MSKKVKCIYAYVGEDDNGNQGIIAGMIPGMGAFPLVAMDMARVESLRHIAVEAANKVGKPVTLCRFSIRSDLDTINPKD